jgi:hypothetical protein
VSAARCAAAKAKGADRIICNLQLSAELVHPDEKSSVLSATIDGVCSLMGHGAGHALHATKFGPPIEAVLNISHKSSFKSKKSWLNDIVIPTLSEIGVTAYTAKRMTPAVGCNVATVVVAGTLVLKAMGEKSEGYFADMPDEHRQIVAKEWNKDPDGFRFETAITVSKVPQLPGKGLETIAHVIAHAVTETVHAVTETINTTRPTMDALSGVK